MQIKETKLKGCFIVEPKVFGDERGYFFESYKQELLEKSIGYKVNFIQDNQSLSSYGVLRGLHFQNGEYAQAKLVRVLKGEVLDVAVDIRPESSTFGQHVAIKLSEENKKQFFVPRGFAHGFIVLSESAEFFYKVDNIYAPNNEGGILFSDQEIGIDWKVALESIQLSDKDKLLPTLKELNL
ncbi:dTDP-4-dehydrorhamnose 3,5-epimerase [bacterium]|nr:dTDP-4-dehydrorhamnose 3,5-epimerase [bacterium]